MILTLKALKKSVSHIVLSGLNSNRDVQSMLYSKLCFDSRKLYMFWFVALQRRKKNYSRTEQVAVKLIYDSFDKR